MLDASARAMFVTAGLTAGNHVITAMYSGNSTFAASPSGDFPRTVLQSNSSTMLSAAPNPANAGQPVTLSATVTPVPILTPDVRTRTIHAAQTAPPPLTGVVAFKEGASLLGFSPVDASGHAAISMPLAPGTHVITAFYGGDSNYIGSMSNSVSVVVNQATGDGPGVLLVQRFGFHAMPTTLVVSFDKALDPASAQDVRNYIIVGPGGFVIPVVSAVYNPADDSVTLLPAQRLDLHLRYQFTIVGTGPGGVKDASGNLLNGAGTGNPGSNFVTTVDAANLVIKGHPPGALAALQLATRARIRVIHKHL